MINALVTGCGGVYGFGTVCNLRRASLDVRIVGADCDAAAAGLYVADAGALLPRVDDDRYLPALISLCKQHRIDVVFVGSGREIPLVAAKRADIEAETDSLVIVNEPALLAITEDKWATMQMLSGIGLPIPESTIETEPEEIAEFVERAGLPVIVKPRIGQGADRITLCTTRDAACTAMGADGDWIAQQHIGDEDHEFTIGVLGNETGEILGSICLRRYLRQGLTVAAEVHEDTAITAYAETAVSHLRPRGYCNVQIRLHEGVPMAFEINGRISSSTGFRGLAGFNEPELVVRHYLLGERTMRPEVAPIRMIRRTQEVEVDEDRWNEFLSAEDSHGRG